jgi:hypothetical protein
MSMNFHLPVIGFFFTLIDYWRFLPDYLSFSWMFTNTFMKFSLVRFEKAAECTGSFLLVRTASTSSYWPNRTSRDGVLEASTAVCRAVQPVEAPYCRLKWLRYTAFLVNYIVNDGTQILAELAFSFLQYNSSKTMVPCSQLRLFLPNCTKSKKLK